MTALWTAAVLAGSLFLNGVEVEPAELVGVEMEGVDVRIDARGNLHIHAPDYEIAVEGETAGTSDEWFLVLEDLGTRDLQVDVYVNGALAARSISGDATRAVLVSDLLQLGANRIRVEALGSSTRGTMTLSLGRADIVDGTVILDTPQLSAPTSGNAAGRAISDLVLNVAR